ncbi:cytoplasmic protein [Bacillus mycoides]|uniref:cytoplasmic protein n=1 Tax=Bacillus mycoides TaxID=1405 RepID=UPI0024ACEA5C|nr:cytoplasmic protein [Bacillus mycoides]MDI6535147.1 cytoplasmic protein [Bacillus mycoides]
MEKYFEEAHRFCSRNRILLEKDIICGCFHCLKVFSPKEITDWWEKEEDTAECPYCGIDSVIGESSGFPITKKFLVEMNKRYF